MGKQMANKKETMLTLLSPAGGERWETGSRHHIVWRAETETSVLIEVSLNDGKSWQTIAGPTTGDGIPGLAPSQRQTRQVSWSAPSLPAAGARVRISLCGGGRKCVTGNAFVICAAPDLPSYRWSCLTAHAPFAPRDGAGLLSWRGRLWLLGGWNPKDKKNFPKICNNEVWSSADGRDWELVKPNTFIDGVYNPDTDWEGRHTAGYAVFQDKMWIIGGDCNQGHYHPDVWYSTDGARWQCAARNVPWGQRCLHHTVAHAGRLWVMGGQTLPSFAPADLAHYNDVWSSADGVNWELATAAAPWTPRGMIGGAAVLNGRIWLPGGGIYGYTPGQQERLYYSDIWSSADGANWKCHDVAPPWPARSYHEVAAFGGRLWVLEGCNVYTPGEINRNDVWHSADGVNWHELPGTPWAPRHAASVCVHNGALWVVAGNNMESDVWKLEVANKPSVR